MAIHRLLETAELPVTHLELHDLDYDDAIMRLKEFRSVAERQRRLLALKYHPDKADGNVERMARVNAAIDRLLDLRINPPQDRLCIVIGAIPTTEVWGSVFCGEDLEGLSQ